MSDAGRFECRICGSKGPFRTLRAREMMFGTRDEFDYLECPDCGTVQIAAIPDLGRYYPEKYYSFESPNSATFKQRLASLAVKVFDITRRIPLSGSLFNIGNIDARLVDRGLGLMSVLRLDMPKNSRILDVGCGSAELLRVLVDLGFTSLTGIDKFLGRDRDESGISLRRAEIADNEGEFDLVMFHHSLEHVADPIAALESAYKLLAGGGTCMVRIPVLNYAWEKYGVDWVGLDAPRHLVLMTERTMKKIAENTGFRVAEVIYDSTSFQFSASEKYSLDIPLVDEREPFSRRQLRDWDNEAKRLNWLGRGDQAAFVLKKIDV